MPFASATLLLLAASSVVAVHDDDPKLLDRTAPYAGPGFRPGALLQTALPVGAAGLGAGAPLLGGLDDGHLDFDRQGVSLLAWLPLGELDPGAFSGNDCWGYVAPSGREYALMGCSNGTAFVEVSTPSDPVLVDFLPGPESLWRDVKVYQDHAYVVSEGGGGIQVVDLSQIDGGVVQLVNTITSGGVSSTHNVAIDTDSGYLYRCGGQSGQGLRIYRLSNPSNPQYVGAWNDRYVHDVQVVTYSSGPFAGRQIAFACSGFGNGSGSTGLTVLDVTNKSNIQVRSQFHYPMPAYSHQAWLSPDRQVLYLDDELDEGGGVPTTTHVIDVSDIDAPAHLGTFTNGNPAIGHNLYTLGDRVYEANYRSGLRIFDVPAGAPTGAVETAYFDTWPGDDSGAFNGLWSCYPYLPSGIVLGSDLERGLFVWWVGPPKLELQASAPELFDPAGEVIEVTITELAPGDLDPATARLWFDAGSGLQELPLLPDGAGAYAATLPPFACGTRVNWFVGARSSDGILWTYPDAAPYDNLDGLVAVATAEVFRDDMELDRGWTVGAPDDGAAPSGVWERVDPIGSTASPEDDHTPGGGSLCWTTGLDGEVTGGWTTLTSPAFDLSGMQAPELEYWLWFQRRGFHQPDDQFRLEITTDGGLSWIELDRINDQEFTRSGRWAHRVHPLAGVVPLAQEVQLRFRVRDIGLDAKVEAAVDDLRIFDAVCECSTARYCVSSWNSVGAGARIGATGSTSVAANDLVLTVDGGPPGKVGVFFYGPKAVQLPLGDGQLCVAGGSVGIRRLAPPLLLDPAGSGSRALDLAALPQPPAPDAITAGSTWRFQFWYRDPTGGPAGSNLSDALLGIFCP